MNKVVRLKHLDWQVTAQDPIMTFRAQLHATRRLPATVRSFKNQCFRLSQSKVMLPHYNPKNPWAKDEGGCSNSAHKKSLRRMNHRLHGQPGTSRLFARLPCLKPGAGTTSATYLGTLQALLVACNCEALVTSVTSDRENNSRKLFVEPCW